MSKSSKILLVFTIIAVLISLAIIGISVGNNSNNNDISISNQAPF